MLRLPIRERQYKRKFSQWRLGKNVKAHEMEAMLQMQREREFEGKDSTFRVRGRPIAPEKLERYVKRRNTIENVESGTLPGKFSAIWVVLEPA